METASDGRAIPILSARLDLMIGQKWPEIGQPKERFDPEEVTLRVGITPTMTSRLGEVRPGRKVPARIDSWAVRVGPKAELDLGVTLAELREMLEPSWDQLVQACGQSDLLAMVSCVVQPQSDLTPIIRLEPSTIAWVAQLGASIDVDVLWYDPSD